jgi:hypothetical protein
MISAHSASETMAQKMDGGSKNEKGRKEGGRGKPKKPRACVQRPQSDIETQCGGFYCRPSLLGVWCACSGPKGLVAARRIRMRSRLYFKLLNNTYRGQLYLPISNPIFLVIDQQNPTSAAGQATLSLFAEGITLKLDELKYALESWR